MITKYFDYPKLCLQYFFSSKGLFVLNLVCLAIMAFSLTDMLHMLINTTDDTASVENIIKGLAALFVAYGVALEEREFLMKTVGYYPQGQTPREAYLDYVSHHYGVLLLIAGLVIEVGIEIIKIFDRFIDMVSLELAVHIVGFLAFLMIGYWLISFCYKLIRNERPPSSYTINT